MPAFEVNVGGGGMSVHNDVCGSVTLYGKGDCVVLPTIESRSSGRMMHGFIGTETMRSVYRLSFFCCY